MATSSLRRGAGASAIVHPDNRASERVAEKIGMRRVDDDHPEGRARRIVLSMSV